MLLCSTVMLLVLLAALQHCYADVLCLLCLLVCMKQISDGLSWNVEGLFAVGSDLDYFCSLHWDCSGIWAVLHWSIFEYGMGHADRSFLKIRGGHKCN